MKLTDDERTVFATAYAVAFAAGVNPDDASDDDETALYAGTIATRAVHAHQRFVRALRALEGGGAS